MLSFTPGWGNLAGAPELSSDAARNAGNEAQRRPGETSGLVRMPDLAAEKSADDAEDAR